MEEKDIRKREKEFRTDLKWLMSSRQGRRFVWTIFCQCGLFGSTLDTNGLMMAAKEGKRQIGNMIFAQMMQVCPDLYVTMTNENKDNL